MKTALLIIDHGSIKKEANEMLDKVGSMIQNMRPDIIVRIAHMELAEPTIAQGIAGCVDGGATKIIAHPYMLSPGRHSKNDIPRLVKESADKYPGLSIVVTGPLGLHQKLCEVVLERADLFDEDITDI